MASNAHAISLSKTGLAVAKQSVDSPIFLAADPSGLHIEELWHGTFADAEALMRNVQSLCMYNFEANLLADPGREWLSGACVGRDVWTNAKLSHRSQHHV
jgi:hypothetical protein